MLLDRSGRLSAAARTLADPCPPDAATTAQQLTDELANWTLMLAQVLARGETARAHALLHGVVAPQQLKLCRLLRGIHRPLAHSQRRAGTGPAGRRP
ncbi:hypothetical protein [Streptomyces sp. NPDC101393]|uniref:hypothetical protein n=1 Tax=Streptomyces sp. NPDC101393 TaxID=3366141 RepID=UPI0037F471E1